MFGFTLITTLRFKALEDFARGLQSENVRLRDELWMVNQARGEIELANARLLAERSAKSVGIQPREQAARLARDAQLQDIQRVQPSDLSDSYLPTLGLFGIGQAAPDAASAVVPSECRTYNPSFDSGGGGDYAGAGATGSWSSDSSSSDSTTSSDSGSCTSSSGD